MLSAAVDPVVAALDWDMLVGCIPQIASEILSTFDSNILNSHPNVTARSGKTAIRDEALFVYRAYSMETQEADSVIVGLMIERNDAYVTVRGDIANEESGVIHFQLKPRSLSGDNEHILQEVRKAAAALAGQWQIVTQAIGKM